MKYDWKNMTEEQKAQAARCEANLPTHMGTTKEELVEIIRWQQSQKPVEPRYENIDCTGLQRYFEPYSPVAVVYRNGQVLPDGSQITGTHDPSTNSFVLDSTPCEVCGNFKHIDCRADNLQFTAVHCPNCGRRLKDGE